MKLTIKKPTTKFRKRKVNLTVWAWMWNSRCFLLKACTAGLLVGLIVVFSIPKEYESSIFVVPESFSITVDGKELMDDFDPEVSINMGGKQKIQDAILPSRYPQVVGSTPFLTSLFGMPVTPHLNKEVGTVTLFEYMAEHQRRPWWSAVRALPFRVIGFLVGLIGEEAPEEVEQQGGEWATDNFRLSKREVAVAAAINNRIEVEVDKTRRTVTFSVRMQDPLVALAVADSVSARLQAYITGYRMKKDTDNYRYMSEMHRQAREEYYSAQKTYARFVDGNQGLSSQNAQKELTKLRVDMNLAYANYAKITKQLQVAKSRAAKKRSVYTVIEPAAMPLKPVSPSMKKILAKYLLLSFLLGCGWLLLKNELSLLNNAAGG